MAQTNAAGDYGSFTIGTDGAWTYTLDNGNGDVQALNEGDSLTDSFTVVTADGTPQVVTVTINGSNDGATIGGNTSGEVTEDVYEGESQSTTSTGTLTASDPDNPDNSFQTGSGDTTYGSFSVDSAGNWTYTLNNGNAAVDALNAQSDPLTDSFTVLTADGTPQLVTVTIHGTNDAAVIGGDTTGTITEDSYEGESQTTTTSGALTAADVDNPDNSFQSGSGNSSYGSFSVDKSGHWTYTLDNGNPAVDALNTDSEPLSDSFTVVAADGTEQVVNITINGSNDAAVLTPAVVNLTETNSSEDISTSGTLTNGDVDSSQTFVAQTGTEGSYGSFSIDANGGWNYTADSAHNEFAAGTTYTDSFTVAAADGTTTTVTVNILGTNDGPVANADVASGDPVDLPSGLIARYSADGTTEDAVGNNDGALQNGASYASGVFGQAFSFDGVNDVFVAPSTGLPTGNEDRTLSVWVKPDAFTTVESFIAGYGSFGTSGGTYQLGTSNTQLFFSQWGNAAFGPELEADQWYNVAVTNVGNAVTLYVNGVEVATGTMTINTPAGTDFLVGARPPVNIPGLLSGEVDEIQVYDHALTPQEIQSIYQQTGPYGNVLSNDTDPDTGDTKSVVGVAAGATEGDVSGQVGTTVIGTYGSLTLGADGNWSYALNYGNSDTQQLGQGEAANDVFTYTMADGSGATSTTTLTLTVHGVNDAPLAGEVTLPQATEDGGAVTITAAQLLGGASDPDGNPLTVTSVNIAGENPGELVDNGNGTWTYTPPENYSGDVVFNYTVSDGSLPASSTASLHIDAVADAPTLTATTVSSGFETGDFAGWLTLGNTSVQTEFAGFGGSNNLDYPASPTEGSYLAVLGTDGATEQEIEGFLGLAPGTLDNQGNGNATVGSTAVFELQVLRAMSFHSTRTSSRTIMFRIMTMRC